MKILILGATGFLGQLVTARLAKDGHELVCLVRNYVIGNAQTNVTPNITYVQATLDDTKALLEHAGSADFVLHFAWDTTPGTSKGQPVVEAVNNLLPTFRFLEQLHTVSACPLVFVSSGGAVYDDALDGKATEVSPLNPKSYYGAGKVSVEMFLRAYAAQTDHPVVIVRPANVYGPGQRIKRQFAIVPTLMQAIRDGSTFTIWGTGKATRDYLYADDFAEFFALLTRTQHEGVNTFNVASQSSCSINDLCELLEQVSAKPLSLERLPERGVDLSGVNFDCSHAAAELGWQATTDLKAGLTKTWEWFLKSQ
ncbi:MAG: NAD-dependent epimerase/dehydratase family protein [Woeseiaceae bacterium]